MKRLALTLCLVSSLTAGCGAREPRAPGAPESKRIETFLGGPRAYSLIAGGSPAVALEAYRVKPYAEAADKGAAAIGDHPIQALE